MAQYRYIFCDLKTDQVITEIDLFGVYCLRQLNLPGQFNGSFQFDQSGKDNIDLVAGTTPGKTWVVVEREGVPVYWGIIWSRTYQSQAKVCQLFGWGFEAFPQRQVILKDLSYTQPATQAFITLWSDMQLVTGRNLNINVPSLNAGPVTTVQVLATDYKYYSEAMDAIADGSNGFDWTIDVTKNNDGSYQKNLRIGYPTLGTSQGPSTVTFEYPGSILNYYSTDSMADAGTNVFVLGAGEGSSMPVSITSQTAMINLQGWPRWDFVSSHKDVTDVNDIVAIANTEQVTRTPPAPTYKAEVAGVSDPVFGSYGMGDAAQLIITDPRFPSPDGGSTPGLVVPTRITGWEIRPPDSTQIESINLLFPGDTVNG